MNGEGGMREKVNGGRREGENVEEEEEMGDGRER